MPATVSREVPVVQEFLEGCFGRGPLRLHDLGEKDVTRFMLVTAERVTPRTHQTHMSVLRSFFRFLLEKGEIAANLTGVVPTVARWRLAGVPKYLSPKQVEMVLASCDRDTDKGRGDFAILLLLVRLGLRACEVTRLELDDIRWRTGELLVRRKGSTVEALPLVAEVGKALAAYVKQDRPKCDSRRVFLRTRAPVVPIAGKSTVTTIVRDALCLHTLSDLVHIVVAERLARHRAELLGRRDIASHSPSVRAGLAC